MMTNAQAALIAAASQLKPVVPTVGAFDLNRTETLKLAREYQTWLDRQDELTKKIIGGNG